MKPQSPTLETDAAPRSAWECQSLSDNMRRSMEIYSPRQLASKLGISQTNIMTAIHSKKLRAHKVNARVYQIESPDAARWWIGLAE